MLYFSSPKSSPDDDDNDSKLQKLLNFCFDLVELNHSEKNNFSILIELNDWSKLIKFLSNSIIVL